MASSSETLHSAASFQKLPGTLTLAADALAWTPSSSSSASASQLRLPLESISGLSMSKAGSATVALQVAFDEVGVKATGIAKAKALFTFTGGIQGDQKKAEEQREAFKEKLVVVIADNRARKGNDGASGSASPAPAPTAAGSSSAATPAVGSPRASVAPPAAAAPARGKTAAPSAASSGGPTELELRISLLKSNPSLAALHRQTVMANIIPDAEFWSHPTRQTMLRAARQAARQQKGRNARIVDPRFTVGKNGELKLEITDEDRKDLLQQNDVLRLAWSENVPEKMDEASFWQRYFTSSLYHVLRTSSRSASLLNNSRSSAGGPSSTSSALLSAGVKPDEIFDSYLPLVQARYTDTLEPPEDGSSGAPPRNRLVDLGATESDHAATGNAKDWTMRGGVEKGVLPLMRRFNEHSGRVLSAALGSGDANQDAASHVMDGAEAQDAEQIGAGGARRPRKKARTEGERGVELDDHSAHARRYEEEIVIEDLEERRQRIAVPLELNIGDDDASGARRAGARRRPPAAAASKPAEPVDVVMLDRGQVLDSMSTALDHMGTAGVVELDFLGGGSKKHSSSSRNGATADGLAVEASLVSLLVARRSRGLVDLSTAVQPDSLRKKLLDAHGSATEVLRHFWHAVCPPDKDDEMALKAEEDQDGPAPGGPPTAEQREAKAKRMMGVMEKVLGQLEEVLRMAREQGEKQQGGGGGDVASVVTAALGTTMDACKRALVVGELVYGGGGGDA